MTEHGKINVGPAGSLKNTAINAAEVSINRANEEVKELAEKEANKEEGDIKYEAIGNPVFNCLTPSKKKINFIAGCYILKNSDPAKQEIEETLQYHIHTGVIRKV